MKKYRIEKYNPKEDRWEDLDGEYSKDDVDNNTKDMEESVGKGYIIVREVFGLNDMTESYAEGWIKLANENPDKVTGLI